MNPFLERLGEELERAARRRARRAPLARWSRRTLVFALGALQPPHMPALPGVYLREEDRGGGGGIGRATVGEIQHGYTLATSYGEGRDKPGHARAYGLAPDGVTAVTLRLGVHDRRSITVP